MTRTDPGEFENLLGRPYPTRTVRFQQLPDPTRGLGHVTREEPWGKKTQASHILQIKMHSTLRFSLKRMSNWGGVSVAIEADRSRLGDLPKKYP